MSEFRSIPSASLLEREAREEGLHALALHVFPSNAGAIALYEEFGYEPAGREKMCLDLR